MKGRLGVLTEQRARCQQPVSAFKEVLSDLDSKRGHPFVSEDLRKQLGAVLSRLAEEVQQNITELDGFEADDTIQKDVASIFDSRVGEPFTAEEMKQVVAEGERRYKAKIPPGFEDQKKPTDQRRYGDLILWKQMLAYGAKLKLPLLFVTDDAKDDWWLKHGGKTLGPLPRLREEATASGQPFYMYSSAGFLGRASEMLKKEVPTEAIQEVRETRERLADSTLALPKEAYESFVKLYPELKDQIGFTSTGITLGPIAGYLADLLSGPATGLERLTRDENWRTLDVASRAALLRLAARLVQPSAGEVSQKRNLRSAEDDTE